ncbi:IS110 family transposase [Paenibacillus filicis]|uniref:IS110 family transposase n=1 Tax=Paenibacillus gyeongsangnamensis TaxID=3388067 RepID=A0ABT4QAH9_9BACL|nr:IS110 family transposase [Paenibacillus filicis]MCZ8513887.1 IS110 family transposase [Paenibacillus filicis]
MKVVYKHCCGLDVHKKSVTACVLTPKGKEIRTFGTMSDDLIQMADWIKSHRCTHVAMESTGVYWKPIFNLLELEELEIMVVNAQHIKAVPGRKTDVKDAEWIANLLRHGLLQGSFIPNREQRELRELVRYRRSLIDERSREVNRIQKVLEGANIKLSSVATDILGVSGRAMIEAMISGIEDPHTLAELAKNKLRNKKNDLERALQGLIGPHQKLMLEAQLKHIDFLDEQIAKLDEEIKLRMEPFEKDLERLDTIPGVGRRTAEQILAEIGTDVKNQFPSANHMCSWAGMTPGNNESAGKRKSGRTRKGNKKLRQALVEAARSAARTKNTYLSSQYHRIAARRGANRAAIAVGHTILTIVYYLLTRNEDYIELGADFYDQRRKDMVIKQSIKRLESLGVKVSIDKSA